MVRRIFEIILVLICLLFMVSCSYRIQRISTEKYKKKPKGTEIALYEGELLEPHTSIAVISSKGFPKSEAEAKKEQLLQLRKIACRLGADAVENITVKKMEKRGMVKNPRTPFPSIMQGITYYEYLEGTAIKYTEKMGVHSKDEIPRFVR